MLYRILLLILFLLPFNSTAETINVKYRPIPVDSKHFQEISLKESTLVKRILFDDSKKYLLVKLNKTFYHYCSINNNVVNNWIKADSLGKFYAINIKGNYDCRLNPVPEYK